MSSETPAPSARDPRLDVAQTVYEFAHGIDQRDWDAYRSLFVAPPAEIRFDYSSYHDRPASAMQVDDWIAAISPLFHGLDATQHSMTNPIVELQEDGRRARCRVYMQALHVLSRDDLEDATGSTECEFTIGGFYEDRLIADQSGPYGWLIDAVALTVWWRRGNERIMELART